MSIKEMKRFGQWVRELIKRYWLKLKLSRFFLGVICLVIGSTSTFCYLEGQKYYDWLMEGRSITIEHLEKGEGSMVSTEGRFTPKAETSDQSGVGEEQSSPAEELKEIVKRVYWVETRNGEDLSGLHGKCVKNGKSNGYSYSPGACYSSDKDLEAIVLDWFERKTEKMSLTEALCLYGGAGQVNQCEYAEKFKDLI